MRALWRFLAPAIPRRASFRTGEFQDGVILAQFGEVDFDSLGE
jgi:hypothetical protein